MNSFTHKLILYCTGVTFASFLVVYFLFNVLVSNYIRAEAERELSGGMVDVASLIYMPVYSFRAAEDMIHSMQAGRFEIMIRAESEPHTPENGSPHLGIRVFPGRMFAPGLPGMFEAREFTLPVEDSILFVEGVFPFGQLNIGAIHSVRPIRQHSMMTTDVIILGTDGEIITPQMEQLTETQRAGVEFLANYYLANQGRFATAEMVMVTGGGSSYYVSTTRHDNTANPFSIIMYTDVSSAMAFTASMNRILGFLLVISGLLSLAFSIAMSAKFKRAIVRLCGYADAIGRGNWDARAGEFSDSEFNRLSKSMDSMSDKLQAYENNQRQFFQNVSHELRTPLMSIQGYAEGLMVDIFEKEEAANIILSEGQKMTDLVSQLLYVSRIDADQEAPKSLLDVREMLAECCESIKPIAQKEGKEVHLGEFGEPAFVEANEEKLSRAVTNILSNAIRHAKTTVEIECHRAGSNLEIIISDDGNGINPADLPHLFERFYKGENGNYGLGLAICRDIVKRLDGDILAENGENEGAVFAIVLPLKK